MCNVLAALGLLLHLRVALTSIDKPTFLTSNEYSSQIGAKPQGVSNATTLVTFSRLIQVSESFYPGPVYPQGLPSLFQSIKMYLSLMMHCLWQCFECCYWHSIVGWLRFKQAALSKWSHSNSRNWHLTTPTRWSSIYASCKETWEVHLAPVFTPPWIPEFPFSQTHKQKTLNIFLRRYWPIWCWVSGITWNETIHLRSTDCLSLICRSCLMSVTCNKPPANIERSTCKSNGAEGLQTLRGAIPHFWSRRLQLKSILEQQIVLRISTKKAQMHPTHIGWIPNYF